MVLISLDRGRFIIVVHPRSTLSLRNQVVPPQDAEFKNEVKSGVSARAFKGDTINQSRQKCILGAYWRVRNFTTTGEGGCWSSPEISKTVEICVIMYHNIHRSR